jgi:hypothetical protein
MELWNVLILPQHCTVSQPRTPPPEQLFFRHCVIWKRFLVQYKQFASRMLLYGEEALLKSKTHLVRSKHHTQRSYDTWTKDGCPVALLWRSTFRKRWRYKLLDTNPVSSAVLSATWNQWSQGYMLKWTHCIYIFRNLRENNFNFTVLKVTYVK